MVPMDVLHALSIFRYHPFVFKTWFLTS
jgi:hypothetical protein